MTAHGDEFWAWETELPDGRVSFVGMQMGGSKTRVPMVHHDRAVVEKMRHLAVAHGRQLKQPVFLRRYQFAEEVERREPRTR